MEMNEIKNPKLRELFENRVDRSCVVTDAMDASLDLCDIGCSDSELIRTIAKQLYEIASDVNSAMSELTDCLIPDVSAKVINDTMNKLSTFATNDVSENTDDVMETDETTLIAEFREALWIHADKHGMKLTDISGWTETKIKSMALNSRICCCDTSRTCPCEIGVDEVNNEADHMCRCSIFTR